MPNEKYLFQKNPKSAPRTQLQDEFSMQHFAIALCYSLSSSKKARTSYSIKRTTHTQQGKANSTTVILQAEKEGCISNIYPYFVCTSACCYL